MDTKFPVLEMVVVVVVLKQGAPVEIDGDCAMPSQWSQVPMSCKHS